MVLFVLPIYSVLAVALSTRLDPIFATPVPEWNPVQWDLSALADAWSSQLGTVMVRTFYYVGAAGVMSLLIGYPVAYYIARYGGRLKALLLVLIIAPFWISYLMRMLSWVNLLQPDGYVNRILMAVGILQEPRGWLDGDSLTVILGLVYGYVPFLVLPLFAALDRIDKNLLEAARDLGAAPARAFLHVTLPLSKQGILAGSVIILLPMFGDYYTPDLLSGATRTTMFGNQIYFFLNSGTGGNRGAALVVILSAVVSLLMIYYLVTVARAAREAR
jgi:spermidine/putrescine transport system permease protein